MHIINVYLHAFSKTEHSCFTNTLTRKQASPAHLTVMHQLYSDSLGELTFTNCGSRLHSLGQTPVLVSDARLEVRRACGQEGKMDMKRRAWWQPGTHKQELKSTEVHKDLCQSQSLSPSRCGCLVEKTEILPFRSQLRSWRSCEETEGEGEQFQSWLLPHSNQGN